MDEQPGKPVRQKISFAASAAKACLEAKAAHRGAGRCRPRGDPGLWRSLGPAGPQYGLDRRRLCQRPCDLRRTRAFAARSPASWWTTTIACARATFLVELDKEPYPGRARREDRPTSMSPFGGSCGRRRPGCVAVEADGQEHSTGNRSTPWRTSTTRSRCFHARVADGRQEPGQCRPLAQLDFDRAAKLVSTDNITARAENMTGGKRR